MASIATRASPNTMRYQANRSNERCDTKRMSHRSFDLFAWYRIVFGLALVAVLATGRSWLAK